MWHAWKYGDLTTGTMSGEDWRGWHLPLIEIWEKKNRPFYPNRFFQNRNNHQLHQKRCWWQSATSSISFLPNTNQCSDLRACMCGLGCRRISTCIALQCGGVRECMLGKCSVKPHPLQLISIFAVTKTASPVAFPKDWQRHEFLELASVGRPMVTSVCI